MSNVKFYNRGKYRFLDLKGSKVFKIESKYTIGSDIEQQLKDIYGINHFGILHLIEHMSFKSPEDYTTLELSNKMNKIGKRNASTSYESLVFWFKTSADNYVEAIKILLNVTLNDLSRVESDEFIAEKGVVMNEIKRYADDVQTMFHLNTRPKLLGNDARANILGDVNIIDKLNIEDLIELKRYINKRVDKILYNIVYDSNEMSIDDVIDTIEMFEGRLSNDIESNYNFLPSISNKEISCSGYNLLPVDSEQDLLNLVFPDVRANYMTRTLGNYYINKLSNDLSIFHQFRDKHGLTYGGSINNSRIGGVQYTNFSVDLQKGKLHFGISLLKEVLNNVYDAYTEDVHNEILDTSLLNERLYSTNLDNYEAIFNIAQHDTSLLEELLEKHGSDVGEYYEYEYKNLTSYDKVKDYLKDLRDAINAYEYIITTNVEGD